MLSVQESGDLIVLGKHACVWQQYLSVISMQVLVLHWHSSARVTAAQPSACFGVPA